MAQPSPSWRCAAWRGNGTAKPGFALRWHSTAQPGMAMAWKGPDLQRDALAKKGTEANSFGGAENCTGTDRHCIGRGMCSPEERGNGLALTGDAWAKISHVRRRLCIVGIGNGIDKVCAAEALHR